MDEREYRQIMEKVEGAVARLRAAVGRGTFYREYFQQHARKPGPLLLTEPEYKIAERAFVALDYERLTRGIPHEVLHGVPRDHDRPPFDVPDKLRRSALGIGYWQFVAVMSPWSEGQYEEAKAKLNEMKRHLREIAKSLVPPKRRDKGFAANVEGFAYALAQRRFFWTLLHGEFLSLKRARSRAGQVNMEEVLRTLKKHYAYLSLPPDFNDKVQRSAHQNALADTARTTGVDPESIPVLFSKKRAHRS